MVQRLWSFHLRWSFSSYGAAPGQWRLLGLPAPHALLPQGPEHLEKTLIWTETSELSKAWRGLRRASKDSQMYVNMNSYEFYLMNLNGLSVYLKKDNEKRCEWPAS